MTLLEIMVALTILGILLSVVLPRLGPFRYRQQLRTTARNLAALIRYARAEAIYGHRVVKLRIDPHRGLYRLDLMVDSVPASRRKGKDLYMVEAMRELPERVFFDRIILYEGNTADPSGMVVLDFTPRGSVTPATIVLADLKGRRMTLEIFGTTGAVEIYPGPPPDYDQAAAQGT